MFVYVCQAQQSFQNFLNADETSSFKIYAIIYN